MTYFVEIPTKIYTSLELTLSLYIYSKTTAKKHWSLSKIGFFGRRTAACNVCPVAIQKFLRKRKDPITDNSFIKSLF